MEFKGWGSFDDLVRACGYTNCNENSENNNSNTGNINNEFNNIGCNDIPNGFQGLDPQLFILVGEILGNIISGRLPFNVQNALGNWLQLVGQVIETYNAQQQYFQSGPGRYFHPKNFNAANQFCTQNQSSASQNTNSNVGNANKSKKNDSKVKNSDESNDDKINQLELCISELKEEIEEIKKLLEK